LLTGAGRKNPKRMKARQNEPAPPSPDIGGPPTAWLIFHPDIGYQRAEKLRALWDEHVKVWPWLTISDRDALADYCELMYEKSKRKLSGAEWSALRGTRTELGGTGSGRAKLGIRNTPGVSQPSKAADPRSEFLSRKYG